MKRTAKAASKKGFTLIELVVVVAIIGVLAGLLVPTMFDAVTNSRIASAQQTAKVIRDRSADGYFYALCDENFTVTFAHYCKDRLPVFNGDALSEFRDKYMIGTGVKLPGMGSIIGTCSDVYTIGSPAAGDYAFGIPVASDANFSKYLSN